MAAAGRRHSLELGASHRRRGDRGNGYSSGWNADNTAQMRDRDSALSPDQRYDTLADLQRPANPDAVWEIAVPNGTYVVRAVAGDPGYFDAVCRIAAEGVLTVNGISNSASRWVEGTATVTVSDGRLTIRSAPGSTDANKICFRQRSRRSDKARMAPGVSAEHLLRPVNRGVPARRQ